MGSAGLPGPPRTTGDTPSLRSTCMVQYDPRNGKLLLFHSNLNKWSLDFPTTWADYRRRWEVFAPPGWRFVSHHTQAPPLLPAAEATAGVGFDIERVCWQILVRLRCEPWFHSYVVDHSANLGETEQVFKYEPSDHYNAFVLDDHMTVRARAHARDSCVCACNTAAAATVRLTRTAAAGAL